MFNTFNKTKIRNLKIFISNGLLQLFLLCYFYMLSFFSGECGGVVVEQLGLRIERSWARSPPAAPYFVLEQDLLTPHTIA